MADKYTFKDVHRLYYWCNKVLPTVYDDSLSYYELLNKIALKLNALIENYNELPEYIEQEITEMLQSEELGSILQAVISNFMLNVKYPPAGITPAVGDGSTDDTEAIQGCIDWASDHGGGAVYIPAGWYLTQSLTLKENVSIIGYDRYATVFTLKGGATEPLVTAQGSNTIAGITLNANTAVQTEYQNAITLTGEDHIVKNVILDGGNYGLESTSSGHLQLTDIIVPGCVIAGLYLHGSAQVQAENVMIENVSEIAGDASYIINNDNGTYQIGTIARVDEGIVINGDGNYVQLRSVNAVTDFTDNGTGNQILVETKTDTLYENRITTAESDIDELEEDLAATNENLEDEVEARTAADSNLSGQISDETTARTTADTELTNSLNTEITNRIDGDDFLRAYIESMIAGVDDLHSYLFNKTVICLGDSLMMGGQGGISIAWPKLLSDEYGCYCYNYGVSGSPISSYGGEPTAMVSRIDAIIAARPTCDIFVLEGGANDKNNDVPIGVTLAETDPNTFFGAINTIISKVQTAYPGVQMFIFTEPLRYRTANNLGLTSEDYAKQLMYISADKNIPCFDMFSGLGFDLYHPYYHWADYGYVHTGTADHHWSEEAYQKLTPIIAKFMYNNGYTTITNSILKWSGVQQLKLYNGWAIGFASATFTDVQTTKFQGDIYAAPYLQVPIPAGLFDPTVNGGKPFYTFTTAFSNGDRWVFSTSALTPTNAGVTVRVMMPDTGPRVISGTVYAAFIGRWK